MEPAASVSVEDYIESVDEARRPTLEALRALVRETVPGAEETVRYGMAHYSRHGDLCAFAAQKRYFSLYMLGRGDVVERHRGELGRLSVGKGCIRFASRDELPLDPVRTMLRESAEANERGSV